MQKRTNPLQLKVKEDLTDKHTEVPIGETAPIEPPLSVPVTPIESIAQTEQSREPARSSLTGGGSSFIPIPQQGKEPSPAKTVFSPIPSLKERLTTTVVASDPITPPDPSENPLYAAYGGDAVGGDAYIAHDIQDATVVEDVGVIDDTLPLVDPSIAPEIGGEEKEPEVQECRLEDDGYSEEDYAMAARFRLSGHASRRLVLGKISRDLCYLAQVMHPDQKLSKILENALLTRLYLENRDAFDALVMRIEEKGGHIKC